MISRTQSEEQESVHVNAGTKQKRSISQLRAAVGGKVITPQDPEYNKARTVFYGGHDRHPAVIVQVANAADVAQVVTFARETGLELAVRSGGHSNAGHSTSEGGIVLDLSNMKALEIDVEGRTAWAETGLTALEYAAATVAHGFVTGFGDTGSVGIGGITLGGGVGYLVRKYGLTIDDLLAADVVTADGNLVRADAGTNPDLFWALRGGGGNFGVVTRFQYRLHPIGTVYGGMLILPATAESIEAFIAESEAATEDLSTIANVMPAPPMPFLPAEIHGRLVILALLVYAGAVEDAERVLEPFRAIAKPLADMLHPMPYTEIYLPEEENYHPVGAARTMFVDKIDRRAAELIVERLKSSPASFSVAQLRVLGGAIARVPEDATAFAHRKRGIMVNLAELHDPTQDGAVYEAWVEDFMAAFRGDSTGVYVNFLSDEGTARVREAYPQATWDRLAAIKARYDPTNLFRLNQNIPPAADSNGKLNTK